MFKKVVAFCSALSLSLSCVLPLASVGADQHENGGHHGGGGKSRFVPYAPFNDILNNINEEIPLSDFWHGVQVIHSSAMDTIPDAATDILQTWDKFKNYLADYMYSNVAGQRVIDLVDYANGSTSGLTTGQNIYSFIAKRQVTLYDRLDDSLTETDTMYFWQDLNHTINHDFTGVQIGDFYMMPNTIFVTREFSNGDIRCFYADASQFSVEASSGSEILHLNFTPGSTLSCVSSDGSVSSLSVPSGYSSSNCRIFFKQLGSNNTNTIDTGTDLVNQSENYSKYNNFVPNGIPSDIMCLVGNEAHDGSMLFPNNTIGGTGLSIKTWYVSSGGFIGTSFNGFNADPDNIDPKKPPAYINEDNRLNPNASLTVNNVSNYNDYGVTYNDVSGKFDLDLNALAAGLAANVVPQFQAVFDGTYSAQPDIDTNDWSTPNLTNNYVDDYNELVVDISNEVQEILDSRSPVWVPPRYPAVNTSVYIPAQTPTYSTYAAATVPAGVISSASTFMHMGFDLFEDLGLLVIIIPCAILALLWKFTGG